MMEIGGQRLRVSSEGHGRPLLLINGIGATGDLFEPFQAQITASDPRQVIVFDAPGVGGSPAPRCPPSMASLSDLVADLIGELGHESVDVLGLSWGGALAQELVRRHPGRVRRLVLVATMHGWTSVPGRPTALSILSSPLRYYSPRYLEAVAPVLYGKEITSHRGLLRRHAYIRASKPPSMIGYTYQLWALRRWTSLPWLHAVKHPTLVLAGDDDPIIPLVNGRVMASRLPQGRLHVVKGGGHLFLFLRAAAMAGIVSTFLDASDPLGVVLTEDRLAATG